MRLIEFSLKRRVTVSMCAVALLIFGVVSFTRLPINLLPDISYPSLTVESRFPGAAPGEVETLVTRPVEEAVGIVSGVKRLTSVSRPGLSQVTMEFDWDRDMDFAALDVRQKLDLVRLPREIDKPVLLRFDPANDPIVRLYVNSDTADLYQLRYVAEEILKKDLESTEGVAAIKINGGFEEEITVRVDEGKLAVLGVSIDQVNQRLQRENVNQAGGSLYEKEARYLVRSRNEFLNLKDIMDTVLLSREDRIVRMSDVATVERGHKQREVITRFGGKESVELAIYKEGDANIVSVSRSLQTRIENVKKELPEGIELVVGVDQSRFIRASIDEVLKNAVLGGLIAIGVLLFFLKDLRSTIIIGVSIPISIIATFFLMYRTGTTMNIMSLGGLALGVGMLVDNAIVVLESIFKKRERGIAPRPAALSGASEVGMAVIASTLTTIAVFLPVVFLEGIAAQLFRDQALTVSFSLIASLAVSLTLIPMMSAIGSGSSGIAGEEPAPPAGRVRRYARAAFVRAPAKLLGWLRVAIGTLFRWTSRALRPVGRAFDSALKRLTDIYPGILRSCLRARWTTVGVVTAIFLAALLLVPGLGTDLIPTFTQGEFQFQVELPEGTPLETTDRYLASIQAAVADLPGVASYSAISGGAGLSLSNTGTEGENSARLQVQMAGDATDEQEQAVIEEIRERLEASGLARFEFSRPTYFTFRTPIEVEIYGDNLDEVHAAAAAVQQQTVGIRGLVDVKTSSELGNPEVQVIFNREQLAQLGLDLSQVAATVRNKVQGEVATRFTEGDREIDILVRSVEAGEASVNDVSTMIIAQRDGRPIFLNSVAEVNLTTGPSEIRRIGQKRAAVVSGSLSGRDMGAVANDVRTVLRSMPLPAGVTASLSGQEEEMRRSLRSLMMAMALAIFLVYLVMASQFESLLHPFVIIFTLPLGAIGVIIALALTGKSISIVAMIGAVMLAGIVVNNAIVLIDAVNQLRRKGVAKHEALVQAGVNRLRPILMTTLTTVLGLLPMAIGFGEGAELRSPLAITVIGGLTVATALTLLVIPVVYSLLDRKVWETEPDVETEPDASNHAEWASYNAETAQ